MADTGTTTRTMLLEVQYDGTAFAGWQLQPETRTVQGVLGEAVVKMVHHSVTLRATSRTDAGVHAMALPVTFDTHREIPAEGFLRGLNTHLPGDVSITRASVQPLGYRARDAAVAKTYRYQVHLGPARWALLTRQAWWIPQDTLDIDAMGQAARCLVGEHDFSAFRAAGCDAASPIRHIHEVRIAADPSAPLVRIDIIGNAFLRSMVRILAGSLVEVGLGRRGPEWMGDVLGSADRTQAGATAPARGLTLVQVHFEGYPRLGKSPPPSQGDG